MRHLFVQFDVRTDLKEVEVHDRRGIATRHVKKNTEFGLFVFASSSSSGFLLAWEDLGRMFDRTFPACAFLFFFFFFFNVEISSRTLIPILRPESVHSGSASWDDCGWMFPDELRVSSFPDRFPHYTWTAAYFQITTKRETYTNCFVSFQIIMNTPRNLTKLWCTLSYRLLCSLSHHHESVVDLDSDVWNWLVCSLSGHHEDAVVQSDSDRGSGRPQITPPASSSGTHVGNRLPSG